VSGPSAEIIAGDDGEADTSAAVAGQRKVETIALAVVLAFALLMAWDNWRTGIGWESTGPQAGYFPFYVALILAGACIFGLGLQLRRWHEAQTPFVRRESFRRVMQVLVPTVAFVPVTQWLGIYVAAFALIAGFMRFIGHIRTWKALVTAAVFVAAMFVIFEIAFNVVMPKGPLERALGF
jgi:hypothetical protein